MSDELLSADAVDAIVLGLGPGGEEVAHTLAEAGLDVVGVEAGLVGGECPYFGCVPTKMMVRAATLLAEARRVDGVAGTADVVPSWALVAERIREEATDDWNDDAAAARFADAGGTLVRGTGRLIAPDTVEVGQRRIRARRAVVVATGTSPAVPPIDGLADTPFWTNRDAVRATAVPDSLIVLGGGAIGVELAQVFARFGAGVTVVESAVRLVPNEEPEAGELLATVFERDGIEVITGVRASRVGYDGHGQRFSVTLDDDRRIHADELLVATGRQVDLDTIGAEAIGADPAARSLDIDERCRVMDGVWAVGDVTGKGAFTHVAVWQARIAAADILGLPHHPAEYTAVPRVTFTDPEIGSVGLSEAGARERGIDVAIGTAEATASARGWIHAVGNEGIIRLIADRRHGVLVGATSVGPVGGEVLGLLTLAVHARVPIAQMRSMIYAYPTFHRGVDDALRDLAEHLDG